MMIRTRVIGVAMVIATTWAAHIQTTYSQPPTAEQPEAKKVKRPQNARPAGKPNPAYTPPKFDAELPNVLIIGDSISIGYTVGVRKRLEGIANVFRPLSNCGPTTRGIAMLDQWIGPPQIDQTQSSGGSQSWSRDERWDVIHFNFGLHDLKFMGPQNQNLASPADPTSHVQVTEDDYRKNLTQIATKLKSTGAKVIWRETTPVPAGAAGRVPGDSQRYNQIAAEVMQAVGGITTDPFFAHAQSIANLQKKADVHYTPEGTEAQADHVAAVLKQALEIDATE